MIGVKYKTANGSSDSKVASFITSAFLPNCRLTIAGSNSELESQARHFLWLVTDVVEYETYEVEETEVENNS